MNPQERLTLLGTRIRKYDIGEDELLRELGKLQPAFDGVKGEATYREKVDAAVEWGKIYLNPLKSEKYSGGREQARGFSLHFCADVRCHYGRFAPLPATSGLPRTTDIILPARLVRSVPTGDIDHG